MYMMKSMSSLCKNQKEIKNTQSFQSFIDLGYPKDVTGQMSDLKPPM